MAFLNYSAIMPKELPNHSSYFLSKELSQANLLECPQALVAHGKDLTLTIGDLHGNSLFLLYALVFHGIAKINASDYQKFAKLYYLQSKFLRRNPIPSRLLVHIEDMRKILSRIQWSNLHFKHVRLIGDELSDRGQNDYFTFLLLELLVKNQIQLSILISNHGIEFLSKYASDQGQYIKETIPDEQSCSWIYFKVLQLFLLEQEKTELLIDLSEWVKTIYVPALKLMDYELISSNWRLILYSHAPNGIQRFLEIFQAFNLPHEFANTFEMAQSIEQLNFKFKKVFTNSFLDFMQMFKKSESLLHEFIWKRGYENQNFEHSVIGNNILFVHGHDNPQQSIKHLICLDSSFAKSMNVNEQKVQVFAVSRAYSLMMAHHYLLHQKALSLQDTKTPKYEVIMDLLPYIKGLQMLMEQKKWDVVYSSIHHLMPKIDKSLSVLIKPRFDGVTISSWNIFNTKPPSSYLYLQNLQAYLQVIIDTLDEKNSKKRSFKT